MSPWTSRRAPAGPLATPTSSSWVRSLPVPAAHPCRSRLQRLILDPLGLHNTEMTPTSYIPSPGPHVYDGERGNYEDSTFWSISWAPNNGASPRELSDLGRWAKALGTGSLPLSASSHTRQFRSLTVGLGPLTSQFYYGLGGVVSNGWDLAEPGLIWGLYGPGQLPTRSKAPRRYIHDGEPQCAPGRPICRRHLQSRGRAARPVFAAGQDRAR